MNFLLNYKQFTPQIRVALLSLLAVMVTACPSDSNDPVLSKAKLEVQPAELDFGENDTQKAFTVKNVGQQNLTWTISEDVDWITDFQSTSGKIDGGGEGQITVKIDRTKLKNGDNNGKIQVTATADDGGQLEGGAKDVTVKATKTVPPQVSMSVNDVTEKTATTAKATGMVVSFGSSNISQHGHVWSTTRNPDINDGDDAKSSLASKTAIGSFQSSLSNLKSNTTYYIRAYATNKQGTTYSSAVEFKTLETVPPQVSMSVNDVTEKTATTAKATGMVVSLGSSNISQHGHVWSTTRNPDINDGDDPKTTRAAMTATGSFQSALSNLTENTTYYIRAYATNKQGTSYSSEVIFKTLKAAQAQVSMSKSDVTEILFTTAKASARVLQLGSSKITQHGFVWSSQTQPTIDDGNDAKITLGPKTATGTFQTTVTNLTDNATYYIRAYLTTADGTLYSSEVPFKTAALSPPRLSMSSNDLSNLKSKSATVRASLDQLGSLPVTEHGHVWSTSNAPAVGDAGSARSRLGATSRIGTFTTNVGGLTSGATYYVRAYASTSRSTIYSNQLSFKTGANNAPTGLLLTNTTIKENQAAGTSMGRFTTVDPDSGDTHTYSLVSGSGSTGNSRFLLKGDSLKSADVFDYEKETTLAIRIRTTDKGGAYFERSFTISIGDEADGSGGKILLSNAQIAENKGENLTIGSFSTIGIGSRYSYTFASGSGSEGNSSFLLVNNELRTNKSFNAESQANYSVRIKSTNLTNGSTTEQVFSIKILDVNEFMPTDINLTKVSLAENQAIGTLVGRLSTTDGDILDKSHSYSLLSGNSSFKVTNDSLKTLKVFDYETTKQINIIIKTSDMGAQTYTKSFTIAISNVNEAPTNISLSKTSIAQDNSINTIIGSLGSTDVDAGDSHIYTLILGGSDFNISRSSLRASKVFKYAVKNTYSIRLKTTDKAGASFEKNFTISILPNNPPTNLTLSKTSIAENNSVNAVIGTLTATDADASDSHTYTLISGGSSFDISGNSLRASKSFDYETRSSYTIQIRTDDGRGGTLEKDFMISITDENDAPTNISLSKTSIIENNTVNAVIGVLTTVDADATNSHTYTLVSGSSDFNISGNSLRASKSFDYETKSSYAIKIRTSDGNGGTFEKGFTIIITDGPDQGDESTMTYNDKTYKTVYIGTQWWMAENLNDDGGGGGRRDCYDDKASNCNTYGGLYIRSNAAYIANKISGWHLPTDAEWDKLCETLGGTKDRYGHCRGIGSKLKQGGSSGFEALLGGFNSNGVNYTSLGEAGLFWSATQVSTSGGIKNTRYHVSASSNDLIRNEISGNEWISVRLVKDD